MRNIVLCTLLLILSARGDAQTGFNDSLAQSRNTLNRHAMLALGSFAVVNIATGFAIGAGSGGPAKYFWNMNGYWNLVNLGIATIGYLGATKALRRKYTLAENEAAQLSIEKLYVFNFGLDLVYITGGFYLKQRGYTETSTKSRDQYNGYGTSIAVQGGFLLILDATMIALHHRNSVRLNKKLQGLALEPGPLGFALCYTF